MSGLRDDLARQALLADARSHRGRNMPYCRSCVEGIEQLSAEVDRLAAQAAAAEAKGGREALLAAAGTFAWEADRLAERTVMTAPDTVRILRKVVVALEERAAALAADQAPPTEENEHG